KELTDQRRAERDDERPRHFAGAEETPGGEIRRESGRVAADADADEDQQRQRAGFHNREARLNELPFANAAKVDPGEDANANERNQPLRSHAQLNCVRRIGASKPRRADVGAWKPCITIRPTRRPQYAEKSPERD